MDLFDVLSLIGGLSLFLFGMNFMGEALERRAGGTLKRTLGRLTTNPWAGLLTGLAVTAVIQSSSATTVMVVGFVNSGMMSLEQAINVIMGANIGTTVTAWILSLTEAFVLYAGAGADRNHHVHGRPHGQQENDGRHSAGICDSHVRHGNHVLRRLRSPL